MTDTKTPSPNLDPISGAPGAHPVGTGVGALLGGAAAGAATGTVAGPVGTVVGAAVGAIVGGLAGKGVAESIDPTAEDAYWRDNYASRPYAGSGLSFDEYRPAYALGVGAFATHHERSFDDVEGTLENDWDRSRGTSTLHWAAARPAAKDAWDRLAQPTERSGYRD